MEMVMEETYEFVEREPGVRVRPEGDDTFLLYHPGTDELHLIDACSKAIFELCDGRSIDEVVAEGAALVCAGREMATDQAAVEVMDFLCGLQRRALVRFL